MFRKKQIGLEMIGRKRRYFLAVVFLLLFISNCQHAPASPPTLAPPQSRAPTGAKAVAFIDENLEAAVRNALFIEGIRVKDEALLNKPIDEEITTAELAKLTRVEAASRDITDISGLEYCTNLTYLNLVENKIIDTIALNYAVVYRFKILIIFQVFAMVNLYMFSKPKGYLDYMEILVIICIGICLGCIYPAFLIMIFFPFQHLFNIKMKNYSQFAFTIDETGYTEFTDEKEKSYNWNQVKNIIKRKNYIFGKVSFMRYFIIPGRCFALKSKFELLYSEILKYVELSGKKS